METVHRVAIRRFRRETDGNLRVAKPGHNFFGQQLHILPHIVIAQEKITLKRRIRSTGGHLCNIDCGAALHTLAGKGTRYFALAHLSECNNTPETALAAANAALADGAVSVKALPREGAGPVYILERDEIWSA